MGIFEDFFGLFDVNGDGNITADEEYLSYIMMEDVMNFDDEQERRHRAALDDDGFGGFGDEDF